MLLTWRKSDRLVVSNTGTNSQYPKEQPPEVVLYELKSAAQNHGGKPNDYDDFIIDDADPVANQVLYSPTVFITLKPNGQPSGVECYDRIQIKRIMYYWHDMSTADDPPPPCKWSDEHFNTKSAIEYFIVFPNNKLDSEVEFTIESDNDKNNGIPVTLGGSGTVKYFGPDGLCGSTQKPVGRIAFMFEKPGTYAVNIWTKWHGHTQDQVTVNSVREEDADQSNTGPIEKKPWRVQLKPGMVWHPHQSDENQQPLQNVVGVRRVEEDDIEKTTRKIKQLENQIERQNDVINNQQLAIDSMAVLWYDFYHEDAPWVTTPGATTRTTESAPESDT